MPKDVYDKLFAVYGSQGWWPLLNHKGTNPTKTGSVAGYHPGEYDFPRNERERFEICMGAVLTQNTSWPQVETAMKNLHALKIKTPDDLLQANEGEIKNAIKPAGYFNQKYLYLVELAKFLQRLKETPTRDELLALKGIGPETADSILLYAFHQPQFVVDAYTRRIFVHLGRIDAKSSYDTIKSHFEAKLPRNVRLFQEYHALIVEHAKRYYRKKPYEDPLLE